MHEPDPRNLSSALRMTSIMDASFHDQSRTLLAKFAEECTAERGLGYMSPSIYDTAWLSMVQKQEDGNTGTWLFPECFQFVLNHQLPSGGWEAYASPVDGVLNTAAALLALRKRIMACPADADLIHRSQMAEEALRQMLSDWNISTSDQVGFEILVTQHIALLEEGVVLRFSQLDSLRALRDAKLSKLPASSVYQAPSTLYHSLEALTGHIDFDQLRCWKEANGSMMSSPSSTAAYLMHASSWDDDAEAYLRNVVNQGSGKGNGGVPCAWPTTIFELTWAVTTLIGAGTVIDEADSSRIGRFLEDIFVAQNGILGFCKMLIIHPRGRGHQSHFQTDDTAQGITALRLLGRIVSPDGLLRTFEAGDHFITYPGERNPSFSANCNVLTCLLSLPDPTPYLPQIAKTASFLIAQAFGGKVHEKWHIKDQYWMMLLAKAFALLSQNCSLFEKLLQLRPKLKEDIPIVTLYILIRLLRSQQVSGAWDGICEVTSYAILALSSLSQLPWIQQLDRGGIIASIARGKSFLDSNRNEWRKGHYLWIEKVTYSSGLLSEVYCLAAALVPTPSISKSPTISYAFALPEKMTRAMQKFGLLISRTPLCSGTEPYILRVAEMQACYALSALQSRDPRIFPRSAKGEDKYLLMIPLAFTASAAVWGSATSPFVLYELMVLSLLNFLADEYMEGVIEKDFGDDLDAIKSPIRQIFLDLSLEARDDRASHIFPSTAATIDQQTAAEITSNVLDSSETENGTQGSTVRKVTLEDVNSVLRAFVRHILHHPAVGTSPSTLRERLAFELQAFLQAHVTHAEDNYRFHLQRIRSGQNCGLNGHDGVENGSGISNGVSNGLNYNNKMALEYRKPGRTFYNWVRSTSADHTSCPFSYIFFHCLVLASSGDRTNDVFSSARTAYLAEDLCRHLANLCRLHNDAGSITRDADEGNLNSVNFPEFHIPSSTISEGALKGTKAKADILWIAEYERKALYTALSQLEEELGGNHQGELIDALRLFVSVTELYGQIYQVKDVGTRTK